MLALVSAASPLKIQLLFRCRHRYRPVTAPGDSLQLGRGPPRLVNSSWGGRYHEHRHITSSTTRSHFQDAGGVSAGGSLVAVSDTTSASSAKRKANSSGQSGPATVTRDQDGCLAITGVRSMH